MIEEQGKHQAEGLPSQWVSFREADLNEAARVANAVRVASRIVLI